MESHLECEGVVKANPYRPYGSASPPANSLAFTMLTNTATFWAS